MAKESNPFSNFLDSWAADPESEAKGRVYSETGRLRGEEANRMASINAARQSFLNDPTVPHSVKMAALGREQMDARNTMDATGAYHANQILAPTNPITGKTSYNIKATPGELTLANSLQGNPYKESAPPNFQIENFNGIPTHIGRTADGMPYINPLIRSVQNTLQPTQPGGSTINVTKGFDDKGNMISIPENAKISGAFNITPDQIAAAQKAQAVTGALNLGVEATKHPLGKYGYMWDARTGAINPDTKQRNPSVKQLNPPQFTALSNLASEIENSGYSPTASFQMALEYFPELRDLKLQERDFNSRTFGDKWLVSDSEKDSQGNPLPNFGGDYNSSKNFDINNLGGLSPGDAIVPFATNMSAMTDQGTIASAVAGGMVKPQIAKLMPDSGLVEQGKFYVKNGRYFVGRQRGDKVVPEEITGRNQ